MGPMGNAAYPFTVQGDAFKARIKDDKLTWYTQSTDRIGYDLTTRTLKLFSMERQQSVVNGTAVASWDSSKEWLTLLWDDGELWTKIPAGGSATTERDSMILQC